MKKQLNFPRISKFILVGVLIVGIGLGVTNWSSESENVYVKAEKIDVPHSFTSEETGLINREISTTDKSAFRLNKYDIKRAMAPTFECSGLKLEENLTLTVDDMIIPLTAYDPNFKIGYIWLDYNLFGEGIIDKTYGQYKSQKKAEQLFLNQVEEGIELFFEDEERFVLDIFGPEPTEDAEDSSEDYEVEVTPFKEQERFINSIPDFKSSEELLKYMRSQKMSIPRVFRDLTINVTRGKWNFFKEAYSDEKSLYEFGQEIKTEMSKLQIYEDRREYLELVFVEYKKMIFLNEQNMNGNKTIVDDWIFSASDIIDDPIRFFGFVERIKDLGFPGASSPLANAMNDEILKITLIDDVKEWWKHSEAVINLMQANKIAVINSMWEYDQLLAEIIENNPYQKWSDHYGKIVALGNKYTISREELEALPSLAATHGICIAPISILDERTIYNMQEQEYQDKLVALRDKIFKAENKTERKPLQKELLGLSQHRSQHYADIRSEAKAKSMQKIIDDMEFFLDWAKEISEDYKANERV